MERTVKFEDLLAVERSVLRNVEAFCGMCDQIPLKNPFIPATKMIIKKLGDCYFFFCPNPEHHSNFRPSDSLFRFRSQTF